MDNPSPETAELSLRQACRRIAFMIITQDQDRGQTADPIHMSMLAEMIIATVESMQNFRLSEDQKSIIRSEMGAPSSPD